MGRNEIDNLGSHLQRLDGAEAESLETRYLEHCRNQFVKGNLPGQIAAVGAQVNPGQHNLFVAALNEFSDFLQRGLRLNTTAPSTDGWNNAERTIRVAPVLNLNYGTCAAARTEMRERFQLALEENVAAKNFGVAVLGSECKFCDKGLMRIADDITHLWKRREFFGRTLSVTTGNDDLRIRISRRNATDCLANVAVGFSSHCA